ncbi:DUF4097 family beta strand repeat-containing protein [Streptomyces sp. NPDC051561]|uniref:DUF4097 family beta strand repeat-containing protein n=1 Tax=Streptomyces sp. NPDC051561 TaxID=3365658 RepID=UPI00378E34D4
MSEWSVTEPQKLNFDAPVTSLSVRVVNGTVNVVGTDGPLDGPSARLEVTELDGPPLVVTHEDGKLTVTYEDLPWKGFLKQFDKLFDQRSWQRRATVTVAVPAGARVDVGVVGASAVVSGVRAATKVRSVTGEVALTGLTGAVSADTASGNVEAQSLTGDLRFKSVTGDLTVVDCAGSSVRAESVGGAMVIDVDTKNGPTDIALTTVSGEIAIRLPHPADAKVEANTTSGTVSNAFEDLRVSGGGGSSSHGGPSAWGWAQKKITGTLGTGAGKLRATTVSGSIALLRRPPHDDVPADAPAAPPSDTPPSGAPSDTPPSDDAPSTGKVL